MRNPGRMEPRHRPHSEPRTRAGDILRTTEEEHAGLNLEVRISDEDWPEVLDVLFKLRNREPMVEFGLYAMNLALAFPERKNELGLDEETWKDLLEDFEHERYISAKRYDCMAERAAILLVLFPARRELLRLEEEDRMWSGMGIHKDLGNLLVEETISRARRKKYGGHSLRYSVDYAILYPNRMDELDLNDNVWKAGLESMEMYRNRTWRYFASEAARMAILFPERRSELNISERERKGIQEELEKHRAKQEWSIFVDLSKNIAILSADAITIDEENGMQLTRRVQKEESLSLPDRRVA